MAAKLVKIHMFSNKTHVYFVQKNLETVTSFGEILALAYAQKPYGRIGV